MIHVEVQFGRKRTDYLINDAGTTGYPCGKKEKSDSYSPSHKD